LHRGTPGHMRLPHRLQGQKSRSRGGGILWRPPIAAQLVLLVEYVKCVYVLFDVHANQADARKINNADDVSIVLLLL